MRRADVPATQSVASNAAARITPGNFANDREKASKGRKGGQS